MALAALFGKKKTPEEMLRQNQRALTKVYKINVSVHGMDVCFLHLRVLVRGVSVFKNLGNERAGQRTFPVGEAREEAGCGHQEDGKKWTNGCCKDYGKGSCQN